MLSTTTREAFRFHHEHAGWSTPPGRAVCALALARAEAALREDDTLHVLWDDEDDADTSWMSARQYADYEEGRTFMLQARLVRECPEHGTDCRHAETLASVGGVHVGSQGSLDPYCRVIEAELASEAGLGDAQGSAK